MKLFFFSLQVGSKFVLKESYFYIKPTVFQVNRGFKTGVSVSKTNSNWGSTKKNRKVKLLYPLDMTDPKIEEALAPLRARVKEQGDLVRKLKADGAPELDVKKAVAELKLRKKLLEDKELSFVSDTQTFDRAKMDDLIKRRFFYDQSFAIYGGITGQYDFGPMGCGFKINLLNAWRNFFVLEEQMLEVDCTILTPEPVLKASGHVDRFADLMVKDVKNGECFRLDHLIKAHLEKIAADKKTDDTVREECKDIIVKLDGMNKDEMAAVVEKFKMKSPSTGNDLTEPIEFNLMFATQIGPDSIKGFLRPETAQGIFVNFKELLRLNEERLPFAAAQIGNAFRNEISPRSGLIRVREFTMAEIEHFCDPSDKSHPKFESVKDTVMLLYSACNQMDGKSAQSIPIGDAVASGLVANETLGFFMAKIQMFLIKVGVDPKKLRFRQHMNNEMAHYACDCWDAECLTSYGWVECVGCADRSAYDLTQHSKATGEKLVTEKKLPEPKVVDVCELLPNREVVEKNFTNEAKSVLAALSTIEKGKVINLEKSLEASGVFNLKLDDGSSISITKDMVTVKKYQKTVDVEEIIPSVIEPSFGIGRIMYAIFEHNFKKREGDEMRTFLSLPPVVAPLKCSILPLSGNAEFVPFLVQLSQGLTRAHVLHKIDFSSISIGKRYARTDEIAIPFGITVDFDTLKVPHSVTLRERDSMGQVRINLDEIPDVVRDLSNGKITWPEVEAKYPKFEQQEYIKVEQGDLSKKSKTDGTSELDVKKVVNDLKINETLLEDKKSSFISEAQTFDQMKIEDFIKRKFFFNESFSIYGGMKGQCDFGPIGCDAKTNLLNTWRNFFVLEEQMLEVDCSILTPEPVLKASGHVDRFADLMVKDVKNGECFRLDHLIKARLEKIAADKKTDDTVREECKDIIVKLDGMNKDEMAAVVEKFKIKSPSTGNDLTEPIALNLMFEIQIGPSGLIKGFLRPDLAQGIFVNFKRLLEFNQERLPFAATQIGNVFRNEISPHSGLIRVREFTMAQIEYFCDPSDKSHPKFESVKDTVMLLYSACNQLDGKSAQSIPIGDAVASGLVANETLGFFMAKIQMFLIKVGVDPKKLRFRQHKNNKMAHCVCDCWDAEYSTSDGWVKCIGCADRSTYDLTQHSKITKVRLAAEKKLPEPKLVDVCEVVPNREIVGKSFKSKAKSVLAALSTIEKEELNDLEKSLETSGTFELKLDDGSRISITKDMVTVKKYQKTMHVEEIIPSVIECSFGIGRIMDAILATVKDK